MEYALLKRFTNSMGIVYYKELACGPYVYVMSMRDMLAEREPEVVLEVVQDRES